MSTSKSGANSPTNESANPLGSSDPSGKTSQGLSGEEQRGQGAAKTVEGGEKQGVTAEAIKVREIFGDSEGKTTGDSDGEPLMGCVSDGSEVGMGVILVIGVEFESESFADQHVRNSYPLFLRTSLRTTHDRHKLDLHHPIGR